MVCLLCLMARLAVVILTFIRISLGSLSGVDTRLEIQPVCPATDSMIPYVSSSSGIRSSFSPLAKRIFCCRWIIRLTLCRSGV